MTNHLLTALFIAGALIGVLAEIFLMQLSGQSEAANLDHPWLMFLRRIGKVAMALVLLYAADYVARQIAEPWLPNVLLVWSVAFNAIIRTVTIYTRMPAIHKMAQAGIIINVEKP